MDSENTMTRQLHSFSWNHDRKAFFNTVFNLRKQEMFCDVTLVCDGVLFPVHRLVLAMCSEFFSEILTKVPCQQPMMVLVPTVGAADLEALLTYIYVGEIRISQASLPSLMKAAHILKIKGLCSTNNEIPWEQYVNHTENEATSADKHIPDIESKENDNDSIIFEPPYCSPEETTQEPQDIHQLQDNLSTFPQVEVFINNGEVTHDMMSEGEEIEEDKEEMKGICIIEEGEEIDPLSVPLLLPHLPTCTPTTSPHPHHLLPLETIITEDLHQDNNFNTTTSSATSTIASTFRYTREQKFQIMKDYYIYGPTKAARLNSERLGRKVNESSVRSIVRAWERDRKLLEVNKELQQT